ncbi:photolyase/cryptochrome alpha/beta domain-containing protein, partial [Haematococcus lacustris]
GDPTDTLPQLVEQSQAGLLVTDFSPLRVGRQWRTQVSERLPGNTVMVEVDAHNVVPCWVVSNKREGVVHVSKHNPREALVVVGPGGSSSLTAGRMLRLSGRTALNRAMHGDTVAVKVTAARTIRPKVHKALPEFLVPFPATPTAPAAWARTPGLLQPEPVDWEGLLREVLARGAEVPEVVWCVPGEAAARAALDGPAGFLSPARLALYAAKRNDPNAQALSNMSPYLHYGQIAPARAALEAAKHRARYKEAVEGFLEELVVRRELADNFCQFTPDYDNISCAAAWARESLDLHRSDPRPYSYT